MQRSIPNRVLTEPCVATSAGVPSPQQAAFPDVGPFRVLPDHDEVDVVRGGARGASRCPGQKVDGPEIYVEVEFEAEPEEEAGFEDAGGTSGAPMAPRRMASTPDSSSSTESGRTSPLRR